MNLTEMAVLYRDSAELLRGRIKELSSQIKSDTDLCEMDKLRLRIRIDTLKKLFRESSETALFLERYYDRGYRANGRSRIPQ